MKSYFTIGEVVYYDKEYYKVLSENGTLIRIENISTGKTFSIHRAFVNRVKGDLQWLIFKRSS